MSPPDQAALQLPTDRKALEALIETAICRLDEIDGDPDLEPGGDEEPSLCVMGRWSDTRSHDDREFDPAEEEPMLGWTERNSLSGRLSAGADDGEADGTAEPSLGSLGGASVPGDQRFWACGNNDEREDQCEDEGGEEADQDTGDYEPDTDAEVQMWANPSWEIEGRPMHSIDGPAALDLDDAPDTIASPRVEWGMAR